MFDAQNFRYLLAPQGRRVTDALLLTFSLDACSLNELLLQSGLADRYDTVREMGDHVFCAYQIDRCAGEANISRFWRDCPFTAAVLAGPHVRPQVPTPLFHPKLWAFLYDQPEPWLRLIVSSRNLTGEDALEGAIVLEGAVGTERVEANAPLLTLLDEIGFSDNSVSHAIRVTDFTPCVERLLGEGSTYRFLTPKSGLKQALEEAASTCRRAVYVSPFCQQGPCCPPAQGDFIFVTRPENGKTETARFLQGEGETYRPLHAKIYAFDGPTGGRLLMGSSNSSVGGFVRNRELMVELTSPHPLTQPLLDGLSPLTDCLTVPPEPISLPEGKPFDLTIPDPAGFWESLERRAGQQRRESALFRFFREIFQVPVRPGEKPIDYAIRCLLAAEDLDDIRVALRQVQTVPAAARPCYEELLDALKLTGGGQNG